MTRLVQRIEKLEGAEQTGEIVVLFAPKEGASQAEQAIHRQNVEQAKEGGQHVIEVKFIQPRAPHHENT